MNKRIINSLFGLLSTVVTINSSYAQTTAMLPPNAGDQKTKYAYHSNNPEPVSQAGVLPPSEVSSKAIRSFEKTFKQTSNLQWHSVERNNYLATFTDHEGRDSRVLLAKNGYIIYAISYGYEENLPGNHKRNIKSRYVDYSIGRVSEVNVNDQKVWLINLEDANTVVIARVTEDGILDEIEHYQKRVLTKKLKKK